MSGLPNLPGYAINTSQLGKERFHKSQAFSFHNNVAISDPSKPGIGGGTPTTPTLKTSAYPTERGQPAQPAWLAFDRQVLRFYGHFQEAVHESRVENYRVRNCTILFYLEDDTIQITEKKTANSGIDQGTLIRRHRIPKPAPHDDEFYTVEDLNVGKEVTLYGRTFALTSCDEFTVDFLGKLGIRVGPQGPAPPDPHTETLKQKAQFTQARRPYEKVDTLRQFLENDRQVLRFYCLWDDSQSMFGDKRYMVLHYYLADDTCEVKEVLPPNSGRSGNGMFYSRAKLPKNIDSLVKHPGGASNNRTVLNVFSKGITDRKSTQILDSLRTGASNDPFYTDADFQIGVSIQLLGRELLICDCDEFTKSYYKTKFGIEEFEPIEVSEPMPEAPKNEPPPPTGYGNDDDSMVSVHKLVLQPPRKYPGKFLPEDAPEVGGNVLRWAAKLDSTDPLSEDRQFILSYYLVDDTFSIYEQPARNAGRPSGKFLERGKYKLPDGARHYDAHDFLKGARLEIQRHPFVLIYADEYTYNFMEQNNFPFSSVDDAMVSSCLHMLSIYLLLLFNMMIQDKLRSAENEQKETLKSLTPREDGSMDASELRAALLDAGVLANEQEVETIVRAFSVGDGAVDHNRLVELLE
eukprot:m.23525 g.23525  ORF g.23525 m.23525 type:complete len:633 (+) comp7511_c0_seq1:131-2029(+)